MAKDKPATTLQIETFADHHVITQPNPLRKVLRRVAERDLDDPVARAEKALADLSGEFKNWMIIETDRLSAAHAAILTEWFYGPPRAKSCFAPPMTSRATPPLSDILPPAPPPRASAGSSSTRPISAEVPSELIAHHINAIQAIVRERTKLDTVSMASELSRQLRGVADEYLTHANRDRPEHLEAILAPSIAPAD